MSTVSISAVERNDVSKLVYELVRKCRKSRGSINCNTCKLSSMIVNLDGKCCDVCDVVLPALASSAKEFDGIILYKRE